MNSTLVILIVVAIVVIFGAILGIGAYSRRKHSRNLKENFGTEYDRTVKSAGSEKNAENELDERKKHVKDMNILPLTSSDRSRYLAEWAVVQSKFVDEPGKAIEDADRLIREVMQLRAYPVADFDQRALDLSVNYPKLVTNYRAAREIAIKNEQHTANTEELRTAMLHYRSLFEELVGPETAV